MWRVPAATGSLPRAANWASTRLHTTAVYPSAGGTVLLAGTVNPPGGLELVNPLQQAFGGVGDGAVILVRSAPGCDAAVLVNAATYRGPYVAPDSLATLFGCALENATNVRVSDATGSPYDAAVIARTSRQLNLVLPGGLAPGPLKVAAYRDGAELAVSDAQLELTAPSLFTAYGTGLGVPAALMLRVASDGTRTTRPVAVCGDVACQPAPIDLGGADDRNYLLLFGTGFRHAGSDQVTVRAGGLNLPVLGHAAQPEYAGLDQVNVELPRALAGAGTLELQVALGEKLANPVTILIR